MVVTGAGVAADGVGAGVAADGVGADVAAVGVTAFGVAAVGVTAFGVVAVVLANNGHHQHGSASASAIGDEMHWKC